MSGNTFLLLTASCAIASLGIAQTNVKTNTNPTLTNQDRKFIEEAAKGGQDEVALGRLAVDKGSDSSVKQFGQRMIDDHSNANQQLMSIASNKAVTLPPEMQSATYRNLSKMSGAQFDRAYKMDMVRDHEKDISAFEKEMNSTQDPDLRQFTTNTLPTLRSHLDQAKAMKP